MLINVTVFVGKESGRMVDKETDRCTDRIKGGGAAVEALGTTLDKR